jgi:hypothetical protein
MGAAFVAAQASNGVSRQHQVIERKVSDSLIVQPEAPYSRVTLNLGGGFGSSNNGAGSNSTNHVGQQPPKRD